MEDQGLFPEPGAYITHNATATKWHRQMQFHRLNAASHYFFPMCGCTPQDL